MSKEVLRAILTDDGAVPRILRRCVPLHECLLWRGYCLPNGYGEIRVRGVNYRVHRIIAFMNHDFDYHDLSIEVCHTCDTRNCCEATHLVVADKSFNMKDMYAKGKRPPPKKPVRFTDDLVQQAREMYASGISGARIAQTLGFSKSTIHKVLVS